MGVPKPAADLKPGTWKYEAKIAMGGAADGAQTSTAIKEENGAWPVTDTMETPMGPATDESTFWTRVR